MVVLDVDEKGTKHYWMPMSLAVRGNSDVKWFQVQGWIKPQDTKFICIRTKPNKVIKCPIKRQTPSLAAFTIQTLPGAFFPSLSFAHYHHRIQLVSISNALLMLSTCYLPRSMALAVCTEINPPAFRCSSGSRSILTHSAVTY